ncbi:MAG TPA: gliding-motility protein MglA [Archangium sp.]
MPRRWIVLLAFALPALAAASFIDYETREVHLKCVYDGPVGVGTDENLRYIHEKTAPELKGKLIKMAPTTGPAAVSFFPLSLGEIRGFKTRFHLYALAGGAPTAAERALVLKGVDGIIFVAYADKARLKENIAAFDALKSALATQGYDWRKMPLTVQLNRADAKGALTADELRAALKLGAEVPLFPANSATGVGVFDTLKSSAKQALAALRTPAAETPKAGGEPAKQP